MGDTRAKAAAGLTVKREPRIEKNRKTALRAKVSARRARLGYLVALPPELSLRLAAPKLLMMWRTLNLTAAFRMVGS